MMSAMYHKFENLITSGLGFILGICYGYIGPQVWITMTQGLKTMLFGSLGAFGAWFMNKRILKPTEKAIEKYGGVKPWLIHIKRQIIIKISRHPKP